MPARSIATEYHVTRAEQDAFAYESHRKAAEATAAGRFAAEILPVPLDQKKGPARLDRDESIRADTSVEALGALRPAFRDDGTVTAGNAPPVNDGAAALVVMSAHARDPTRLLTDGPHRRAGDERSCSQVHPDDTGRSREACGAEGRMAARRGRPVRDQRGVLRADRCRPSTARNRSDAR